MSTKAHQTKVPILDLNWILVLVCVTTPIKGMQSRKLDETPVPATTNGGEKCIPCGGSTPSPPPPVVYYSPPPPSPPPPIIYPSPPPPPPKKSPSQNCPPPPSSTSYLYITGPPGNLYPVDANYSGASPSRHGNFSALLPLLIGLLIFLAFW